MADLILRNLIVCLVLVGLTLILFLNDDVYHRSCIIQPSFRRMVVKEVNYVEFDNSTSSTEQESIDNNRESTFNTPPRRGFSFKKSVASIGKFFASTTKPLPLPLTPSNASCLLIDHKTNMTRTNHILLFIDSKFYPIYHNWHLHFLDVCGDQRLDLLEVVCMDHDVALPLSNLGVKCSPHSFTFQNGSLHAQRQATIWLKRLKVIVFYLQHNVDLVLSDSDAIWRSDPYLDLSYWSSAPHHAEVLAGRGTFPRSLQQVWGATVCMGFIYLRATPFTVKLMQNVLIDMQQRIPIMQGIQMQIMDLQKQIADLTMTVDVNSTSLVTESTADNENHNEVDNEDSASNATARYDTTNISTPITVLTSKLNELFSLREFEGNKPDDQYSINYALYHLNITWQPYFHHVNSSSQFDIASIVRNHTHSEAHKVI